MKNYVKPEMKETLLLDIDIIRTSGGGEEYVPTTLKTSVNGKEGANYGVQDVSIYD